MVYLYCLGTRHTYTGSPLQVQQKENRSIFNTKQNNNKLVIFNLI